MAILKDLIVLGAGRITGDLYAKSIFEDGTALSSKYAAYSHTHSQYLTGQDHYSSGITAQTTQALYPIKISASGHITAYGSAVTSLPASDVYSWAKASTKPSYNLDEVSDGSTRKLANYLPLGGGTLTGLLKWNNGNALPQQTSPQYMLCLDAFSNGGTTKWCELSDLRKSLNLFATEYSTSGSTASFYFDDTIRKMGCTKTDQNWNAQIYSNTGYVNDIVLTYKASQTDKYIMFGLDNNPTESANYNTIDYCWYTQSGGGLCMYENGTQISSISGHTSYAVGDELRIEYRDGNVLYYHNNVVCRTVARTVSGKLYMDSSFYNGGYVYDVWFGPSIHYTPSAFAAASHTHDYLYGIQTTATQTDASWAKTTANTYRRAFFYNTSGVEYSYLFGLSTAGTNATHGAVLKMGYSDKYLRIIRVSGGTWQSTDWEKISAGYADSAGSAPASDVYSWAKASTKPSYNLDEVSDGSTRKLSNYLPLSGGTLTGDLYVNSSTDVGVNKAGAFIVGNKDGENIGIDGNEIMARNNGSVSTLYLNADGGTVNIGGSLGVGTANPGAKIHVNGGVVQITNNSNTVSIGNLNNSWCHFQNSANIPFYFNRSINVDGAIQVYNTSYQLNSATSVVNDLRVSGNDLYVGSVSAAQCHMQYDSSNECMKFLFD